MKQPEPASAAGESNRRVRSIGVLVVIVVAMVSYLPSLRNGFAYDDVAIIQTDQRVHSLSDLPAVFTEPYWHDPEMGLYRPLVTLSYAIDWSVSDGSALWFHFVNVVWNAAACAALFLLLTGFVPAGAALAGALLFAVHPLHVEAVANVVGRAELMAAVFMFAALLAWLGGAADRGASRSRTAAVAALFALALFSKESAIMLPALIVLVDAGRRALTPSNALTWLRRNAAVFVLLGIVAAGYMVARTLVLGELGPTRLAAALEVVGPLEQRLTALQIWPIIVRLLLVPAVLLPDYAPRIIMPATGLNANVLLGAAILVALAGGGVAAWLRGRAALALTLLWLPIALLPVSNLIIPIGVLVAERALYLPSAAFAVGAAFALASFARVRAMTLGYAVAGVVAALFTARTFVRIPEWASTDAVFVALLRDRPDSYAAHWHMARIAWRENQPALALERYGRALELWPHRRRLVLEAAGQAARAGDLAYSRRLTSYMLEHWPDDLDAARMLAGAALDQGDTLAARSAIDSALLRHPADSLLRRMRAAIAPDSAS